MGTTASPFLNPIAAELEGAGPRPAARLLPRRGIGAFSLGMPITISAGVATLRAGESSDNLLARADSALYASKAKGRDRITSA